MAEGGADSRYRAFISYSHADERTAKWLHRKLETYRIPRRLVGQQGVNGPVPSRLKPIFRDRAELPVSGDLSAQVKAALTASDCMVLLCSPAAAASRWVNREVELFRQMHPERQIFPVIVTGTVDNAFPAALTADGHEPVAADLHPDKDGRRLGFLKVAAGLAGVGLDALVQRDAQRRLRRVMAVTGVAVAAMLGFAILLTFAISAQREAERQRAEAEGLVEFMLTDLRDRLRGVGRLDVLTAVNERALDYYEDQTLDGLPADSLERRARILLAMGEDDLDRRELDRAASQFREARRVTAALLAAEPGNPERMFAHAQSEYWVGSIANLRGDMTTQERSFQAYANLAERMVRADPGNAKYELEREYALNNLCAMEVLKEEEPVKAERLCRHALEYRQDRLADPSLDDDDRTGLAISHAWYADALVLAGREEDAVGQRAKQLAVVRDLMAQDPSNQVYKEDLARALMSSAELAKLVGNQRDMKKFAQQGQAVFAELLQFDPENKDWASLAARLDSLEKGNDEPATGKED